MDLRHVMASVLTISMFVMLGNMIKRDHFDSAVILDVPITSSVQHDVVKVSRQSLVEITSVNKEHLFKEYNRLRNPCWKKPLGSKEHSKGFITFSLSGGPEYHLSQIADAVLVAKYLGAMLVLPDVIGKNGKKRDFGEFYDVEKFLLSMHGVVLILRDKPPEISSGKLISVRVPYMVTEDYISTNIEPFFRRKGNLRLVSYFSSRNMRYGNENMRMNPYSCLVMFESLHLQAELQEVVDSMVKKLRMMSSKVNADFVAVDFGGEMLGKHGCPENGVHDMKSCYNAAEIAQFLQNIGFHKETTIYVTHSGWNNSLDALAKIFPNTFTKENIMEQVEKETIPTMEISEFGRIVDFHICSSSDVFVPTVSGLFYANVVGNRIASGKTRVLVPTKIASSASNHISSYISKKSHPAYSCFC